jgi:hypothetical protein
MIGRQYMVDWLLQMNWVMIGRQYVVDWVTLFVKNELGHDMQTLHDWLGHIIF